MNEVNTVERPVMPGYLVRGACGREWFVPLERVRDDYADFLMTADKLTPEDAMTKADENRDFWHTWFFEQCYEWSDIERLGRLVKTSSLAQSQWQPIETAPKDGTKVLAYTNDGYKYPLVCQCVWGDGAWWPDVWESPDEPLSPTHWMPLLTPPAIQGDKQP